MSVKAMTWVFEHSPYEGRERLIHLALADVANSDYEWRVWMRRKAIADKARCSERTVSETMQKMVEEGYLGFISAATKSKPAMYQLLFPQQNAEQLFPGKENTEQSETDAGKYDAETGEYTVSSNSKNSTIPKQKTLGDVLNISERNRIKDAMIEACGWNESSLVARDFKRLNQAATEILERKGEAVGVPKVVAAMQASFDRPGNGILITPEGIAKHWVSFAPPPALSSDEQAEREFRDRVYAQWDRDGTWMNAEFAWITTDPAECGILRLVDSTGHPVNAEGRRYHRSGASPRVYDS